MGYILPINYEQYTQYQVRDIKSNYNFYQIEHPHRTCRSRLFQEKNRRRYEAKITGKGRFIDITI
jgi:hypothetical protein